MLKARCGGRTSDYWAEIKVVVPKAKKMTAAFAQSQRDATYFAATFRSVELYEVKRLANFEDFFDGTAREEINRLFLCHFSCEVLLIGG